MQRHYAHHRLNGEKHNATTFLSARRDDARRAQVSFCGPENPGRHLHEPGVAFTSTRAAREWLILNMAGLEREEFRVLYLNNQNQLIAGETLFTGTINRTEVHPREVIKRALYHNAAAVVLAHNHPSGEVPPSKADRLITERLVQALGLVDIRVPDHLIVGGNQVFSFAEHGLL
ncbi:putative DNA repair protein [Escherichia coli]|nr:putative DNA repair protein [Escherichia coli]